MAGKFGGGSGGSDSASVAHCGYQKTRPMILSNYLASKPLTPSFSNNLVTSKRLDGELRIRDDGLIVALAKVAGVYLFGGITNVGTETGVKNLRGVRGEVAPGGLASVEDACV